MTNGLGKKFAARGSAKKKEREAKPAPRNIEAGANASAKKGRTKQSSQPLSKAPASKTVRGNQQQRLSSHESHASQESLARLESLVCFEPASATTEVAPGCSQVRPNAEGGSEASGIGFDTRVADGLHLLDKPAQASAAPNLCRLAAQRWAKSFVMSDPRRQIYHFFLHGDEHGPSGLQHTRVLGAGVRRVSSFTSSEQVRLVTTSAWTDGSSDGAAGGSQFFSIWRPTSTAAIRKMMKNEASGKGNNIKGKSAKRGVLSGFVPYLQIHGSERDKKLVGTAFPDAETRIYYKSMELRAAAKAKLDETLAEMVEAVRMAKDALDAARKSHTMLNCEERKRLLVLTVFWSIDNPVVKVLETEEGSHSGKTREELFGLSVPDRLLWEAYVVRQDITQPKGWETGRPSSPDYMDLNMQSIREVDPDNPPVVLYQFDEQDPLNPHGLLLAYAEKGNVLPVASDFDAFLIGSSGVKYPTVPKAQEPYILSLVKHIDNILSIPSYESWNERWMEIIKGETAMASNESKNESFVSRAKRKQSLIAGSFKKKHVDGKLGFGDAISQEMIRRASHDIGYGAVRHAAESFNYYWPQPPDAKYLVVWQGYGNSVPWRSLSPTELLSFLLKRAADGYTFPINPMWMLCHDGWYDLYETLASSSAAQASIEAWFAPRVREALAAVRRKHSAGFVRQGHRPPSPVSSPQAEAGDDDAQSEEPLTRELAELLVRRHMVLRRARHKLSPIRHFLSQRHLPAAEIG